MEKGTKSTNLGYFRVLCHDVGIPRSSVGPRRGMAKREVWTTSGTLRRSVTPLLRFDPIGRSEPDLGCSDTVTLQLGIGCQVRGHSFFFSLHINFKLVHSYNVNI